MAEETPTTFTEDGARRIVEEVLRTTALPRNDFHRRRRHVNLAGAGQVIMFRLEAEQLRGMAAHARIIDPKTLITKPGAVIVVQDDDHKWYGRGVPAPAGDEGGDPPGESNIGKAMRTGAEEDDSRVYSIIAMGTWFRFITGNLTASSWEVDAGSVQGWDGEWARADDGTASGTLTLSGACVDPVEGAFFIAVFDERGRTYRVITLCCQEV